jgi:hypothetical protein
MQIKRLKTKIAQGQLSDLRRVRHVNMHHAMA